MAYIPNAERYTQMEYRRCGRSGLKLPLLSMGLWHNFGDTNSLEHMAQLCEPHLTAASHILIWQTTTVRRQVLRNGTSASC